MVDWALCQFPVTYKGLERSSPPWSGSSRYLPTSFGQQSPPHLDLWESCTSFIWAISAAYRASHATYSIFVSYHSGSIYSFYLFYLLYSPSSQATALQDRAPRISRMYVEISMLRVYFFSLTQSSLTLPYVSFSCAHAQLTSSSSAMYSRIYMFSIPCQICHSLYPVWASTYSSCHKFF